MKNSALTLSSAQQKAGASQVDCCENRPALSGGYLKHMYETAVGDTRAKETNKAHAAPYIKALSILKGIVVEPKTAGLPDPNAVASVTGQGQKRIADTASSQAQAKAKRGTSAPGTYASAVTGKADGQHTQLAARPETLPQQRYLRSMQAEPLLLLCLHQILRRPLLR